MGFKSRPDIKNMENFILVGSQSVPASAWVDSTTFSGYPYVADITIPGVTNFWNVDITFRQQDADILGGAFTTSEPSGTVHIYAKNKPTDAITIAKCECYHSGDD